MRNKTSGSILVVFLFVAIAVGVFLVGFVRWSGAVLKIRRQQIALQNILMTVLRTQAASLESMAAQATGLKKWTKTADASGLVVSSSDMKAFQNAASHLKSSLTGYKGRITAVRKVTADANGIDNDGVVVSLPLHPAIGITMEGQWIKNEMGNKTWVDSVWVRRVWGTFEAESPALPHATAVYHLPDSPVGAFDLHSTASVLWEGRTDIATRSDTNGGFPRFWEEARSNTQFNPYRQSYFSARLQWDDGDLP